MRPIDADTLVNDLYNDIPIRAFGSCKRIGEMIKYIEKRPTIDAVPVKHGRWIDNKDSIIGEIIERNCSLCGQRTTGLYDHFFPYCPNCGAKMDKEESMRLPDGWLYTPRQDKKDRTKVLIEQTEIVRCRNCRYYDTECCEDGFGWCHRRKFETNDDWFCADGERRESE